MQKSKHLTSLIGFIGFIDIVLVILLFVSNAFWALENQEVLAQLASILKQLNVKRIAIIGSVLATAFGIIINYNILKVMFQLSVDELTWQELLLLYLMSSLLAFIIVYPSKYFFNISDTIAPLCINIIYGMLLWVLANVFIQQKKETGKVNWQGQIKLNLLLIAYGLINALVVFIGMQNV